MIIQKERLERALMMLERSTVLRGGGLSLRVEPDEWYGDRYAFLLDVEELCNVEGFELSCDNERTVRIDILEPDARDKVLYLSGLIKGKMKPL